MSVEIQQLYTKVDSLSAELKAVTKSISEIKEILARQEGQNLAARIHSLETKVGDIEKYQAERSWIPEQVEINTKEILTINKFIWKLAGVVTVLNAVGLIAGKFILDKIFP